MDTVLNLGLNDITVEALAKKSGDRRFAFDSYRRFVQMYSDVVLGIEINHFEKHLERAKQKRGVKQESREAAFVVALISHLTNPIVPGLTCKRFVQPEPLSMLLCRTASCCPKTWSSWSSRTRPWFSWSLARSSRTIPKHSCGGPLVQSSIRG